MKRNRVRNPTDFLTRLKDLRDRYETVHRPIVDALRTRYANGPGLVEPMLEFHERTYLINGLLAALNWRLDKGPDDGLPNLVPEAEVISVASDRRRFLDYLGFERVTEHPLLLVESKRRGIALPDLVARTTAQPLEFSEIIRRGLEGEKLSGPWSEWLDSLRDYVRSVADRGGNPPGRALLTNGDWLIAFLAPEAFLSDGFPDETKIFVVPTVKDINEATAGELFERVEYYKVAGTLPPLAPAEVPFHVNGQQVTGVIHGLRIRYVSHIATPQVPPAIWVHAVVFLQTIAGSWLVVEEPYDQYRHEVGRDSEGLKRHLDNVAEAGRKLLDAVNSQLRLKLRPRTLKSHYEDEDAFEVLPSVRQIGTDEFLVCTGDKTHYLLWGFRFVKCPYHDWALAYKEGVATNPPIIRASSDPRAFFSTGQEHHCAHSAVEVKKATPVTPENKDRCGRRSGEAWGGAFCEIRGFESHLCCRTCAFEEVCTAATKVFTLPCKRR